VVRDRLEEICYAAESASELIEAELQRGIDAASSTRAVSQHHILAILRAWANACEAIRIAGPSSKSFARDWSGIPQRSQHVFDTYQERKGTTGTPSIESVNQVLKAWAYSSEHLRGTMAEQFFQRHGTSPNGESFQLMIRVWSWSKERRCAFTATGHLMRMLRLLETGRPDMEPTLEDYSIVFQAWTTAE
jgi:hypothetical protein